jgi:hypothetical protein
MFHATLNASSLLRAHLLAVFEGLSSHSATAAQSFLSEARNLIFKVFNWLEGSLSKSPQWSRISSTQTKALDPSRQPPTQYSLHFDCHSKDLLLINQR